MSLKLVVRNEPIPLDGSATATVKEIGGVCCLRKIERSPGPMLKEVESLTHKARTSVSRRCARRVVVCEKSEVTAVEGRT